jgi:ABC-type transport system involved in multi-copper enzyme maturation permease subunit
MITSKIIFLTLFFIGWVFLLALAIGETYALNNTKPRFTKWWRKHWIGIEDELYSRKQNKK